MVQRNTRTLSWALKRLVDEHGDDDANQTSDDPAPHLQDEKPEFPDVSVDAVEAGVHAPGKIVELRAKGGMAGLKAIPTPNWSAGR
jgi:hypothetical protein